MASMQVERANEEQSHAQEQQSTRSAGKEQKVHAQLIKSNQVLGSKFKDHKESAQPVAGKKHDGQSVEQKQSSAEEKNHGGLHLGTAVQKKEGASCSNVDQKKNGSSGKAGHQQHKVVPDVKEKDHNGGVAGSVQSKKSELKSKDDHQSKDHREKKVVSEEENKPASNKKETRGLNKDLKSNTRAERQDKKKGKAGKK